MDLRQPTLVPTDVGRGLLNGRKYVGTFYVTPSGRHAHSTTLGACSLGSDHQRMAVFSVDGELYTRDEWQVTICEKCPPLGEMDRTWKERGACFDVQDDGFFMERESSRIIKTYCDGCPVLRECFEYGSLMPDQNSGTIWGGTWFPVHPVRRGPILEKRRKELDT